MTKEEKLQMLGRNVWRKKEVNTYFDDIFTTCEINAILRKIKVKTLAPKQTVYRDEVLKLFKTSVDKEIKMLNKIDGERNDKKEEEKTGNNL